MHVVRRLSLLATAFTLGVAVLVSALGSRPSISEDAARSLASAARYFDSTVALARSARPVGEAGDQLAISLGYLERLRLGLGSPFRLVDEALADRRLALSARARVAWALLDRLRRGDAYVIPPAALDGLGPWSPTGHGAPGAAHLALISQAVASASDPRAGELAVRLAYGIEAARGAVSSSAPAVVAQAAALIRDRASSELDLRDLLADANKAHGDVLALLRTRRADRSLRVEGPTLLPLPEALQIEAINAVPGLVAALDTLDRAAPSGRAGRSASLLNRYFASRLAALGAHQPPVAQVVVTLGMRVQSGIHATNEETLAARLAESTAPGGSVARRTALTMLATAVSLRPLAQNKPWFTGDGGPSVADLNEEFGLAGVTFARDVPLAWRPYYLRELRSGLRDLQRVLPGFSASGLRVRFTGERLRDSALAMHEPRTRTLELSIATSGGTLAHELSHDLDWQAARRLFVDGTGYSTDRAVHEQAGTLAASVKGLAAVRALRSGSWPTGPAANRPAEIFARGADWFVASSLARQGRMNGFLSVAEDGLLSGYAAGSPAALGLAGARSLIAVLTQMTYVPDSVRVGFEAQWSDPESVDPALVVQRVSEMSYRTQRRPVRSAGRRGLRIGAPTVRMVDAIVSATHATTCVAEPSRVMLARQRLLSMAIDARASSIAARRAHYRPLVAADRDPGTLREMLRSALAERLSSGLAEQGLVPLVPEPFRAAAPSCSPIAP